MQPSDCCSVTCCSCTCPRTAAFCVGRARKDSTAASMCVDAPKSFVCMVSVLIWFDVCFCSCSSSVISCWDNRLKRLSCSPAPASPSCLFLWCLMTARLIAWQRALRSGVGGVLTFSMFTKHCVLMVQSPSLSLLGSSCR
jgi:hypothetical protein